MWPDSSIKTFRLRDIGFILVGFCLRNSQDNCESSAKEDGLSLAFIMGMTELCCDLCEGLPHALYIKPGFSIWWVTSICSGSAASGNVTPVKAGGKGNPL